jgi:hypothetical protein
VRLEHLSVTGALYGIYAANGANSDHITLSNLDVFGNQQRGIYVETSNDEWLIADSLLHNNGSQGLMMSDSRRSRVERNEAYSQSTGISVTVTGGASDTTEVTDNVAHDNSSIGIDVGNNVNASGNQAFRQPIGIRVTGDARAEGNFVHHNATGIDSSSGAQIAANWIYANTSVGLRTFSNVADGNHVFSNPVGIWDTGFSSFENNVVYANTNIGARITSTHNAGDGFFNNTVYQLVGDAVKLESVSNFAVVNNILEVDEGYALNVDSVSLLNVSSDWNLFETTPGSPTAQPHVALAGGANRTTLANWQSVSAEDLNSDSGDPRFLDRNGADNVLGELGLTTGNGFDDNFGLDAFSPAIDSGNAFLAPRTDIEDRNRHDDPTTPNTGTGLDLFVATDTGASSYNGSAGTAQNWRSTNASNSLALGFSFAFYGKTYTSVWVNTNGYLHFGTSGQNNGGDANSIDVLKSNVRIAPLWDNTTTSATGKDVFVDKTLAGQVTIRWAAKRQLDNGTVTADDVNFSVTLFNDGRFRFDYGPGNQNLTPTIGISAGNGETFVLATYDGQADLNGVNSLLWQPTPGLVYYDRGAYEFQGDSGDTTSPQVLDVTKLPADGGTTAAAFTAIQVSFSEALDGISARSPANYELLEAGADGVFATGDEVLRSVTPFYTYPETNLTLSFGSILPEGKYRLTLSGTKAIFDTAGNPLDGNGDGAPGGDYVRFFTIDRTTNIAPVAQNQAVSVAENGSLELTLVGNDANGDPLVYSIVTPPAHGTLSALDPVTHKATYTPHADYNGSDSFQFMVDDGNAGTDIGDVTLTVAPVNAAPSGADQAVTLPEDGSRLIVIDGTDDETGRANLSFNLASGPSHGTLALGPSGGWTYTPFADYDGPDSFTYTVTDRGDPDGSVANAKTSAPATVSITVTPGNDSPTLAAIADQVVLEGSPLLVTFAGTDLEGNPLLYSLVSAPAGALVDQLTGEFSWTPADGAESVVITARVAEDGNPTNRAERSFTIDVANVAPSLTLSGDPSVLRGDPYTLNLAATDPGLDTISGWTINWGDGSPLQNVAGNPASVEHTYAIAGSFTIAANATDEDGSYPAPTHNVSVLTPNVAPVAADPNIVTLEDTATVIVLLATDANGDALEYSVLSSPIYGTLSAIDPVTHALTYTPDANYFGPDSFTFEVDDGRGGTDTGTVNINVLSVNDAPVLAPIDRRAVYEGELYTATAAATDADVGHSVSYSLVSAPAGATIDPVTGAFSWLASDGDAVYTITVRATDNGTPERSGEMSFDIRVNDTPPVVSISGEPTVVAGDPYIFLFSAVDPGDDTIDHWDIYFDGIRATTVPGDRTGAEFIFTAPAKDLEIVVIAVNEDGDFFESRPLFVDVLSTYLRVESLTPTSTGFHVEFNHAFEQSVINLYSGAPTLLGAPDVVVTGATAGPEGTPGPIHGSLVFDQDGQGFTFIKTGGPLLADTYTVKLRSAADGFKDDPWTGPFIDPLDGDGDDILGGDFVGGFTVSEPSVPVLSIADFARGNRQAVDVPAGVRGVPTMSGLPIRISDGAGIQFIAFELHYRHDLLVVNGVDRGDDLPDDARLDYDLSEPGVVRIDVGMPAVYDTLGAGAKTLAVLRATVGADAVYGDKQILDLTDIAVSGAAGGAIDDDGIQVVAFFGDTSGNRAYSIPDEDPSDGVPYSTLDVARLDRVLTRHDTGFGAYPNADPVLIADINGNGALSALDKTRLLQEVNFVAGILPTDRGEIPPIPAGITPVAFVGPDPKVDLPREVRVKPGETFTVPVRLDTTAGLDSAQLRLDWDAAALELVAVSRGSVTGDFEYLVERREADALYVDMSRLHALGAGSGSLLELQFRARADARPGTVDLDLSWVSLNEGRLVLNPLPQPGADETDARVTIESAVLPEAPVERPGLLSALAAALKAKLLGTARPEAVERAAVAGFISVEPETRDSVRTPPRVEWSSSAATKAAALNPDGRSTWLRSFVGQGSSATGANANTTLKVTLPSAAPVTPTVSPRA